MGALIRICHILVKIRLLSEGYRLPCGWVNLVLFTIVLSILGVLAVVLINVVLGRHACSLGLGRIILLVIRIVIAIRLLRISWLLLLDRALSSCIPVPVRVPVLAAYRWLLRLLLLWVLKDWICLLVIVARFSLFLFTPIVSVVANERVIVP